MVQKQEQWAWPIVMALEDFCSSHGIEISFISSVEQTGMVKMIKVNDMVYIDSGDLPNLEKFVHLYHDLDINLEGIETINHLLQKIYGLQTEIIELKNRLRLYETETSIV